MTTAEKYILVGKLGKTRGYEGEIYVTPATDFPERFLDLKAILVAHRSGWNLLKIVSSRLVGDRPVLRFEGMKTKEDAARLTNCDLAVTPEQLVELPEGSFYEFDLIGCEVIDSATGEPFGKLKEVLRYPANDVYVVERENSPEVMIPAVRDYVERIDIDERRVYVVTDKLLDED